MQVDLDALSRGLLPRDRINRIRYFTALVNARDDPQTQREFGIKVGVVNPHPAHKRSRDLRPTFFKQLRENALRKSQFPSTLQDSQGAITKPERWR